MRSNPVYLLLAASIYIAVLFAVYDNYLFAIFEYAHFHHVARTFGQTAISVALGFVPLLADRGGNSLGRLFSAVIYSLYYLPAIVITLLSLERPYGDVLLLHGCLCLSMSMIFFAGSLFPPRGADKPISKAARQAFSLITLILIGIIVAAYGGHIRLVSFSDVYDLRTENTDLVNPIVGYFVMWLSYGLLPFVLSCGIVYREKVGWLLGLLGCLMIYGATGAKTAALTPVFVFGLYFLSKQKGDILPILLATISSVCLAFMYLAPDDGVFGALKAVLFMRTVATPGWALSIYYDFFAVHPLTYLSQVGIINSITQAYSYGGSGLGQVLGIEISGTAAANFNTGFWASEGIASFWLVGIPISGAFVSLYLVVLNRVTRGYDGLFLRAWACGFAMSLLNLPFFTALLSGGGLLMLAMALSLPHWTPQRRRKPYGTITA